MRYLNKPTDKPRTVFLRCISGIPDPDLVTRLTNCANSVNAASHEFESKVASNELYTIVKNKATKANKKIRVLDGEVTIEEMKNVYTENFAAIGSPGRPLYDTIMGLPLNSRCPYCFHRQVSTLDHYLPKAYYPYLSVVPSNLIPSCKDCNMSKLAGLPTSSTEEILHPYFDNVENEPWLMAEVVKTSPVSLRFFVKPYSGWTVTLQQRVRNHFDSLDLATLYGSEAANELINIRYQLKEQLRIGGGNAVHRHLHTEAKSRLAANVNSWQTAMYLAISTDPWFCDGGFEK